MSRRGGKRAIPVGSLRLATVAVIGVAALGLAGCGPQAQPVASTVTVTVPAAAEPVAAGATTAAAPPSTASTPASTASPRGTAMNRRPAGAEARFAADFAKVRSRLSGPAGVAIVPVGGGESLRAGDLTTGVAWSTSKVPLAIAAQRNDDSAATRSDVTLAIRDSDNPAAERLWAGLGSGERAASAVEAVLREAGDATTRVPPTKTRPPYTAFGQTRWSVDLAATFAANLPCIDGSSDVLINMGDVSGSQQWGFWNVRGAAVKGGWGPVGDGYLVRQIAVVPAGDGHAGVAALVQARSFEAGQRDLDTIAKWAAGYLNDMGGACR